MPYNIFRPFLASVMVCCVIAGSGGRSAGAADTLPPHSVNSGAACPTITFQSAFGGGKDGITVTYKTNDSASVTKFQNDVLQHNYKKGLTCDRKKSAILLQRFIDIQTELVCQGHKCGDIVFQYGDGFTPQGTNVGKSPHNECAALDVTVKGMSGSDFAAAARRVANSRGNGGVGYYGDDLPPQVDVGMRRDWGPDRTEFSCKDGGKLCGEYKIKTSCQQSR